MDISFTNICFEFGNTTILNGFSQTINAGEHVCIIGKSGEGKSTLLNSVVGLTIPSQGEIMVAGFPVNTENIHNIRSNIAWLPQELNLPYDTVKELFEAPYQLKVNANKRLDKKRLFEFLILNELDVSIYDKQLRYISGGERQRLMLISIMMLDKKIVLLDEPTSALDGLTRTKLSLFLKTFSETTILAITHDEEFASFFDRTIILKNNMQ